MSHHLILQGPALETASAQDLLQQLARHCAATRIERRGTRLACLHEAQPAPEIATLCQAAALDHGYLPADRRLSDFRLFVTDMDSTLISIECIDEIADLAGRKAEVAAVTEAAMRGEIDFAESLTRRVALLEGLPASALETVYAQRLKLNPGAQTLLATLQAAGIVCVLVSGGFTYFTERLRQGLGFAHAWANELEVIDGRLSGRIQGRVIDASAKRQALEETAARIGATPAQCIAMGDGANDLEMFAAAGLSLAYRAKPLVRAQASYALDHSGLDGLLPLLGACRT